jgi:hypothetical protein
MTGSWCVATEAGSGDNPTEGVSSFHSREPNESAHDGRDFDATRAPRQPAQ